MTDGHHPARRGSLRIYLGSAPRGGQDLRDARRGPAARRTRNGCRGRPRGDPRPSQDRRDAGRAGDPPRQQLSYRGTEFTELDVAAVVARRPDWCWSTSSRTPTPPVRSNEKRWQDIDEILAAGIDVLSTVNVQHLESLNDVVETDHRDTPARDRARRMGARGRADRAGGHHPRGAAPANGTRQRVRTEKVDAAMSNYFKPVNLVALRELALMWVADEVDVALQRHRSEQHITEVWDARERVVVAVTGGPESETVLRRAARIAKRAGSGRGGADLLCVHVLRSDGLAGAPPAALSRLRRLADDVGASFHTVVGGEDLPAALLDFARGANATQLVLGTSRRSPTGPAVQSRHRCHRNPGFGLDRRPHRHPPARRRRAPAARGPQRRAGQPADGGLGARARRCPGPQPQPVSTVRTCSACPPMWCCSSWPRCWSR